MTKHKHEKSSNLLGDDFETTIDFDDIKFDDEAMIIPLARLCE